MKVTSETPQRMAVVIEKNKSDTWSVGAYLVTVDGQRKRRSIGVFETYEEAAKSLITAWQLASTNGAPSDSDGVCQLSR